MPFWISGSPKVNYIFVYTMIKNVHSVELYAHESLKLFLLPPPPPLSPSREQLLFPFQFLGRIGKHDMVCTVSGGGRSAQAGAIRLASAKALRSFVTEKEVEFMRQGRN